MFDNKMEIELPALFAVLRKDTKIRAVITFVY